MAKNKVITEDTVLDLGEDFLGKVILEQALPIIQRELLPKQLELGWIYKAIKEGQDYILPQYPLSKIQNRILEWNNVRGNFEYDALAELEMMNEEDDEEKFAIESFNEAILEEDKCKAMCERLDALCDKEVVFTGTLAKSGLVEAPLTEELLKYYEEYKQIPKIVKELGFEFKKCMIETLLEIESRQQDPEQKLRWKNQGGSLGEKWQKWREQPEETLYKADYKKCKIKDCCK